MECSEFIISAPAPTCDLGAVKTDLAFLLDTSVDSTTVLSFRNVINAAAKSLTLSSANTQIAVMSLSDQPMQGGSFNFANGNSKTLLLNNLKTINSDGHNGQDVTSAVPALMREFYSRNGGYRAGSNDVKKLLVYITATEPTDKDPANAIFTMTESGTTGFALVTAYLENPSKRLRSMADGGCTYRAATYDDLIKNAPNFILNLLCSQSRVCNIP